MKTITIQMLRDKLMMHGPSSLWDLEVILGITTVRDAQVMVNVVHEAVEQEAIMAKIIKIENEEHVLYLTPWRTL